MKQIHLSPKLLVQVCILGSLGIILSGCTKPVDGGKTLQNQPNTSDIVKQTNLGSNSNSDSDAAPQQVTPPSSVVNNQGLPMKQLSDFPPNEATQATIATSKGDVVIRLFRDEAPLTTLNFITLADSGFYDGIVFHRIIPGFMSQVGDPLTKDPNKKDLWGTGNPGYAIADEFGPGLTHDKAGVVSMANSGPNTGGSQFFITHEETPWLDSKHAVFGQVTDGMDVVLSLEVGDTITGITLQ